MGQTNIRDINNANSIIIKTNNNIIIDFDYIVQCKVLLTM